MEGEAVTAPKRGPSDSPISLIIQLHSPHRGKLWRETHLLATTVKAPYCNWQRMAFDIRGNVLAKRQPPSQRGTRLLAATAEIRTAPTKRRRNTLNFIFLRSAGTVSDFIFIFSFAWRSSCSLSCCVRLT